MFGIKGTGLTDAQLEKRAIQGPSQHCAERIMQRYGVSTQKEALNIYRRHHRLLCKGRGEFLCGDEDLGYLVRLEDLGRFWYIIRRKSDLALIYVSVTYLTEGMAMWNLRHDPPDRCAAQG